MKWFKKILILALILVVLSPLSYWLSESVRITVYKTTFLFPYDSISQWGRKRLLEKTDGCLFIIAYANKHCDNAAALEKLNEAYEPNSFYNSGPSTSEESESISTINRAFASPVLMLALLNRYINSSSDCGYRASAAYFLREIIVRHEPAYRNFLDCLSIKLQDQKVLWQDKHRLIQMTHFCVYWAMVYPKAHFNKADIIAVLEDCQKKDSNKTGWQKAIDDFRRIR